jgi:hypothetical protein
VWNDLKTSLFGNLKLMKTCAHCGALEGTPGVAFDRDHRIPLTDGGLRDPSNEQDLCVPCHREKTAHENSQRVTEDNTEWVANKIKELQSRKSEHTYRSYTVDHLVNSKKEGELMNAASNRDAVWPESKQSDFVSSVLTGTSCNAFWINQVRTTPDDQRLDVYDGNNRLTSLENFMTGKLHLIFNKGRAKINVRYTEKCHVKGCKGCTRMTDNERRKFGMRSMDAFIFDNLSSEEACERAKKINEGTPMQPGERLKMILGKRNAPRTALLDDLYKSLEFILVFGEKDHRCQGLLFLGRLLVSLDKDITTPMQFKPRCQSVMTGVVETYFDQQAPLKEDYELLSKTIKHILREISQHITEHDIKTRTSHLTYLRTVAQMAIVKKYDVETVLKNFRLRLDDKSAGELSQEDVDAIMELGNHNKRAKLTNFLP